MGCISLYFPLFDSPQAGQQLQNLPKELALIPAPEQLGEEVPQLILQGPPRPESATVRLEALHVRIRDPYRLKPRLHTVVKHRTQVKCRQRPVVFLKKRLHQPEPL